MVLVMMILMITNDMIMTHSTDMNLRSLNATLGHAYLL